MSDLPRRPPPRDDLPEELRALIHGARRPAPLSQETRARLRQRIVAATAPSRPAARPAGRGAHWLRLAFAAVVLLFFWALARAGLQPPVALPRPDPALRPTNPPRPAEEPRDLAPADGIPAGPRDEPGPRGPKDPSPPGAPAWLAVKNRCADAVCNADPTCCPGAADDHCDEVLLETARLKSNLSGGMGGCYYHDRESCPDCACDYYVKVGDAKAGSLGFDSGTGCVRSREVVLSTLKQLCAQAACE